MKKITLVFLLIVAIAPFSSAFAVDYSDPKQRNPTGDKDVERGYQEHQKEYQERKEERERKERGEIEKPFNVDKSGGTTEHQKK